MKNIIELLIALICVYAIFLQLLRITWLIFPSFIKSTKLYKVKEPQKFEMLLYYVLAITAMAYYITVTVESIL